ncbi:MAG: hypothetical protein PHQ90_08370, partial [Sulfuricurvum sp.]|nr:hypothetical protein [Sulfuricurvum sp.]
MKTQRISFGQTNPDKKNAVFLAIYVDAISPWRYFKDDMQHLKCPALIMIDRWDGRMGFPGGTVDEGESLYCYRKCNCNCKLFRSKRWIIQSNNC